MNMHSFAVVTSLNLNAVQIFLLLHHRCPSPDYPSHRGSVGTETDQTVSHWIIGPQWDYYGQADLIHELPASVISQEEGEVDTEAVLLTF